MLINVTVVPKAKRKKIEKQSDGSYKVWTTVAPEDGKATRDVIDQLADEISVAKSLITLVRGETSRKKIFEIA